MAHSRILYLSSLMGCCTFCIAYGQWFSWVLLTAVLVFPWISLLLSLGAMVRFQACPAIPEQLLMGSRAQLWLVGKSPLPLPPFRGTMRLRSCFTGETLRYHDDKGVPTTCGSFTVTVTRGKVYDYLGLFSLPIRKSSGKVLRILPKPIPVWDFPFLTDHSLPVLHAGSAAEAEHHEIRPFLPGDRLNQIHWKLSAKTGQLLLREPTFLQRPMGLVTFSLQGTPSELDRKLGRFVWLGNHLLHHQMPFQLEVLTGTGLQTFSIQDFQDLQYTLEELLICPPTRETICPEPNQPVFWHYSIGGEPDDAT